jgi:hypothetical protein
MYKKYKFNFIRNHVLYHSQAVKKLIVKRYYPNNPFDDQQIEIYIDPNKVNQNVFTQIAQLPLKAINNSLIQAALSGNTQAT